MSNMTPVAIENDKNLGCPLVPVDKIYLDHDFNVRERFVAGDCLELARDTAARGLLQPITVRELRPKADQGVNGEEELIAKGFTHKVIAGHRRLTAYKINNAELIPAYVKPAYMSDFDCKDINAVENLQRKELNLAEEAEAIRHYWLAHWNRADIAARINKTQGWVQQRMMLLEMPKEVLELAAQGYILVSDLATLNKYKHNIKQLLEKAAVLRDARKKGQKHGVARLIKKREAYNSSKVRGKADIQELQEVIREYMEKVDPERPVTVRDFITEQGNGVTTKVMGWATGVVSEGELHRYLLKFFESLGVVYEMPEFDDAKLW